MVVSDGVDRGPNGFPYMDPEQSDIGQWESGEYHLKVVRTDGESVSVNLTEEQFDAMREAFEYVEEGNEEPEVTV